ncbi:MAG: hypothetical protein KBD63_06490 [Bacteriovoracaceae bacterium]|nr:hypothetical protein [Bacteriovoracaceae bacterium]
MKKTLLVVALGLFSVGVFAQDGGASIRAKWQADYWTAKKSSSTPVQKITKSVGENCIEPEAKPKPVVVTKPVVKSDLEKAREAYNYNPFLRHR